LDSSDRNELLAAAEQARRRLELLANAGAMFSRSLDPQATLLAIASLIVPGIADWCRVDLLDSNGVLQRALTQHSDPDKTRFGTELANRLRAAPGAVGSMAWVVETGKSHLAHFDPPLQFDRLRDKDLLSFAEAIGMSAYYLVPLVARGRTLGALAALQAESGRKITPDDCALISEIAQRAAVALDNARLYADMQAAREQAENANRAKDEFLAMLGHELRNPLAPIVTALYLMEKRGDGTATSERRIIERQVAHLSRLVDDLLDVSRITKGKIQLERARTDMKAVVARAVELTQPAMEKRSRALQVELPAGPVFVHGDAVRLAQVLSNLLTNAAKFTPDEGRIALRLKAPAARGDSIEIAVEDAGLGIAPSLLPHVFDLFRQGEQPSDRKEGGLGLGLAIVKTLVGMHGGSVSAESGGTGRGSTFTVKLPPAGDETAAVPDDSSGLHALRGNGRVLVVDDNADAASTLAQLLEEIGYEVRAVGDGPAALATLEGFVPDLAILDIGLPGMDGYELARRMKADPRAPKLKFIALTGYGREPDRGRALAAEFQEHLVKPVSIERLFGAIKRLMQDGPP
jgi:signal transduction histidine kinase/ActR/RegA family two-component response regulator